MFRILFHLHRIWIAVEIWTEMWWEDRFAVGVLIDKVSRQGHGLLFGCWLSVVLARIWEQSYSEWELVSLGG